MVEQGDENNLARNSHDIPGLNAEESRKAATLIQKTYRGHRARRELDGLNLSASTRWVEALKDARYQQLTRPRQPTNPSVVASDQSPTSAKQNWRRVTQVARRAGDDDESSSPSELTGDEDEAVQHLSPAEREVRRRRLSEVHERQEKTAKSMDLSYFLELVDRQHRHGSNLRKYHAFWQTQPTSQSFFYWLDQGDGKSVDLQECPRGKLNTLQVRYLSKEERLQYLVRVKDGLLFWAARGEPVWTKDELFKDSLKGIVPINDPTPAFQYNIEPKTESSSDLTSNNSEDAVETLKPDKSLQYEKEDRHRAEAPLITGGAGADTLSRQKSINGSKKRRKWIFVADTSFRMYVGYKQRGAFQHSSFLHGSRVLVAGQLRVDRGQLRRLAPLSGHYRPTTENFHAFVKNLKAAGVDMSRVSISESYAILLGLESYTKVRSTIKTAEEGIAHQKDKILHPEKVEEAERAKMDNSQSAKREREHLEQQRKEEHNAKANMSPRARLSSIMKRMSIKSRGYGSGA